MASAYLTRTPTSAGNRKTFTISVWVKKTAISSESAICSAYTADNDFGVFSLRFGAGSNLNKININRWSQDIATNRLFRDTSAWYHIVLAVDTTQATASDRIKLYVNGVQETSFSASNYPNQNDDLQFNNNSEHNIGRNLLSTPSGLFDGCMTHFHFIDGTAYNADTFGETDSTSGIWKPKTNPSVTYGTNGFFLKFENSSDFGEDSSGNNNDFTTSGTITQTEDTPSNNFATMNPLDVSGNPAPPTFANGNLSVDSVATSQNASARSTLAVSAGKWYVEAKQVGTASPEYMRIGILGADSSTYISSNNDIGYHSTGYAYKSTGVKANNNTETSYGNSYTNGDIIGIAFDADNGTIWFSKNGTWQNSATITEIQNGTTTNSAFSSISMTRYFMFASSMAGATSGLKYEWNFGNGYFGGTAVSSSNSDSAGLGLFEYSVPSGYYSLCTKNIKNYG